MTRNQIKDPFLLGYLDAALWTADEDAPGGKDYVASGRAGDMYEAFPDWFIKQAKVNCAAFQMVHATTLSKAGSAEQNGHDFWLTRNHHGAGFWDRGYPKDISDRLTESAEKMGEVDFTAEDFEMEEAE